MFKEAKGAVALKAQLLHNGNKWTRHENATRLLLRSMYESCSYWEYLFSFFV